MRSQDIVVWMEEHAYCALSDWLPEETSIEQELTRMLEQFYEQTVPAGERQKVLELAKREEQEAMAAELERLRFVLIKVVKDGEASHRITEDYRSPLEAAHACESCILEAGKMSSAEFAKKAYQRSIPITQEEFERRCQTGGREVWAVYCIDLDENKMEANVVGNTFTQQLDILVQAAKEAYHPFGLQMEQRMQIFADKIRELASLSEEECGQEAGSTQMVQDM